MWEELCKNKNIITELASQYHASAVDGTSQASEKSHPEKFRMYLGKMNYARLMATGENVQVDIRHFTNVHQTYKDEYVDKLIDPT